MTNKYRNQKVVTPHGTFDSKREYRRYQELMLLQRAGKISELRRQVKYEPVEPLEGALQLVCKWCFPLDKGRRHRDGEYKTSKPDTDNLQKLLKDCMTDLRFWGDDAQVASEVTEKFWADIPGIFVQIRPLNSMEQEET